MVQERHPLSKAFKSGILLEMHKKSKMVVPVYFINFSLRWFKPVEVIFKKCVNFYFVTAKTWILHAWSIFFKGAQLTKLWSKKYFP
jgi:hypothetical protein